MGALWDGVALSGNIEEAQRTCKKKAEMEPKALLPVPSAPSFAPSGPGLPDGRAWTRR